MKYTLGSLFDGSGGFPLAASLCGIEPVWASEVEPYPIAVTRSRFPDMKHLGSVTDIHGDEVEPVDIITFGSPCQDLSVAGKRAGIRHEANGDEETTRSGLFMEAVRIIKEMREATGGEYPSFALWENVPGAFSSSKGEDFRVVLEELIGIVEPGAVVPPVPKAGWAYADSYTGDGWSLAYRVFDAQHWGVPQRRRRIHLVLDLRGERAREALFEREGVRGYFAQSGTQGEGTAEDAQGSPVSDDQAGDSVSEEIHLGGIAVVDAAPYAFHLQQDPIGGPVLSPVTEVCEPVPIHNQATRFAGKRGEKTDGKGNGLGVGLAGDPMNTLTAADRHAVAYAISSKQQSLVTTDGCANTLGANDYKEPQAVAYLASGKETAGTLMANAGTKLWLGNQEAFSGDYHIVEEKIQATYAKQAIGEYKQSDIASSQTARQYKEPTDLIRTQYIVRRLTPTECARLQGFPDTWGHPNKLDSLTSEEYRFWQEVRNTHAAINGKQIKDYTEAQMLKWYNGLHTDSAEYKMWGNGIALPPALYCMQGIAEALEWEEMMNG